MFFVIAFSSCFFYFFIFCRREVFLSSYLICRIIKKIKIFLQCFLCLLFAAFFRAAFLVCWNPGRVWRQTKKYPAGSEPAGLYIINKGGCCGSPRRAVDAPPRVINMKKVSLRQQGNFFLCFLHMFFAYLAFASCYVSPSVVVPAAYVTVRWCRMVVIAPLPYIYNMTNNLKNKNHFF